jgi:iron complex transport system substrate-binding protein
MGRVVIGVILEVLCVCASAEPQRIVSMNLCTDQLLLLLAPERVVSVSMLAADPRASTMAETAARLPLNHGYAEEIIRFEPDLVVAGRYTTRATARLLRKLGYMVLELEPALRLADVPAQLRRLGDAVGESERAARLIAEFDARLEQLTPAPGARPLFADYNMNGWVSGRGTLMTDIAEAAGLTSLGAELGIEGVRQISLERLLLARPALIVLASRWDDAPALAPQILRHPAFQRLTAQAQVARIAESDSACGLPSSLDAVAALSAARLRLSR